MSAVSVDRVPHFQVCAKFVLSMVFVVVAEVSEESEMNAPLPQPVQVPVTIMLPTVVVPDIAALPAMFTLP